jgi:hypothetical protein
LAPGDVIRIFVPRRAELSGEFALDCQGYLVEPLGIPLLVAGLTTRQLEDEIEAELKSDGYMDEPRVSVTRIGGCVFRIPGPQTVGQGADPPSGPTARSSASVTYQPHYDPTVKAPPP